MSVSRLSRRLGWLTLLALLCWPRAAIAAEPVEQQVYADFDGDGQRDHAAVDATESSILRVWLSKTQRAGVLRAQSPVVRLAALDLDGDGRVDLVATTARSTGLHVWKARGGRFKRYQPRPIATTLTPGTTHRSIEDHPIGAGDSAPTQTYSDPAALDANAPALASPLRYRVRAPLHDQRSCAHRPSDPSVPRAPPSILA
jgi:hypothetical protein